MNPLPPNADELVSAYLDGQAALDEIAIVESSPELMERVDALRSVSGLLGAPLAVPPEQKEAHISAALDAFDSLFASDDSAEPAKHVAPLLAAVPPITTESSPPAEQPAAVTSLSDARERRRPRRFNSGVIAAAVATVLLFVALAAFGLSGNDSMDVASTSADTHSSSSDASDDAVDTAEETMQIESAEVMADEEGAMDEEESNSALNEVQPPAAAPQATETIEEAAVEEAEAAPAAAEFDETQDSSPDSDGSNGDDAAASGATELRDTTPFGFLGQFPTQKSLQLELGDLPIERLDQRVEPVDPLEPGLFASCQQAVPELADVKVPTLIGQALVVDQAVEVHLVIADDGTVTILIVDTKNCSVLPTAS